MKKKEKQIIGLNIGTNFMANTLVSYEKNKFIVQNPSFALAKSVSWVTTVSDNDVLKKKLSIDKTLDDKLIYKYIKNNLATLIGINDVYFDFLHQKDVNLNQITIFATHKKIIDDIREKFKKSKHKIAAIYPKSNCLFNFFHYLKQKNKFIDGQNFLILVSDEDSLFIYFYESKLREITFIKEEKKENIINIRELLITELKMANIRHHIDKIVIFSPKFALLSEKLQDFAENCPILNGYQLIYQVGDFIFAENSSLDFFSFISACNFFYQKERYEYN